MEENNKNEAIEKTERVAEKSKTENHGNTPSKKNGNVKKSKKQSAANKKKTREKEAEKRAAEAKIKKAAEEEKKAAAKKEKEEAKLAKLRKRENAKKLKAENIKKRAKERAAKKRAAYEKRENAAAEKKRKKEDIAALKIKKREERLKRKELLKHESKKERQKRIAAQKKQKLEMRRAKIEDRKQKRIEKQKERRLERDLKSRERKEKRESRKGYGGWLAAVISLGCTVLVLGGLLTFTFFSPVDEYLIGSDAAEAKNFYDLVGYVDNLDVNLSKLTVSADKKEQQKLLGEVRVQSNLATSSLSSLALRDEDKYYTSKFINQIGDFSKYLNEKLIKGGKISDKDAEIIGNLYRINAELKNSLTELAGKIDENFDFRTLYEAKENNLIISEFSKLESAATEYPHMIYDGAFSDGSAGKELKALEGLEEIDKTKAIAAFNGYFKDYNVKDATLTGEAKGKNIECYNIEGHTEDGAVLSAQISKKGGKLILFNHYKDCTQDKITSSEAQAIAEKFLQNAGINDMRAVWMTDENHTVTFNFASLTDGIICYSDLVKVNVCKERGEVSGIETTSYYKNHVERNVGKAVLTVAEAKAKVSNSIEIETSRLAVIPAGETGREILAYEFTGTFGGSLYYVYIDAETGEEADIFKVVKTTEGTLLM